MEITNRKVIRSDRSLGLSVPCFHCSKNLSWIKGRGLTYLELTVNLIVRRLHISCEDAFLENQPTNTDFDIDQSWDKLIEEMF